MNDIGFARINKRKLELIKPDRFDIKENESSCYNIKLCQIHIYADLVYELSANRLIWKN